MRRRWSELRRDILSQERLVAMLDGEFSYLHGSGAYDRNYRLWPNGTAYWDDRYIYEYVEGRLAYLDDYFETPWLDERRLLIISEKSPLWRRLVWPQHKSVRKGKIRLK